jgi:hypothetical protein
MTKISDRGPLEPTPQTKSQLKRVNERPITTFALINPSLVLLNSAKTLKFFLSRNTLFLPDEIRLQGVRLIEIPLGWRLSLLRFVSRFCKAALPDEFEFLELSINSSLSPSPVFWGQSTIGHVEKPIPLIHLTSPEYLWLFNMKGRTLHLWVARAFTRRGNIKVKDRRYAA